MNRIAHYFKNLLDSVRFKKGRTVKTMFSLLGAALLLGAAVISGNSASYIRLQSDKTTIKAGDHFILDVYANAAVPVNAVNVTVNFKEGNVEVLGVDKGQSVLTIWTQEPVVEKTRVVISGGTFRKGFVGEHKIASLDLLAKQTGQSTFSVSDVQFLAGDGKGTPIKVTPSDDSTMSFLVYNETSDPAKAAVSVSLTGVTDIDGDGKVSLKDVSAFMGAWANNTYVYDFNGDGKMTFGDFSIILANVFLGH